MTNTGRHIESGATMQRANMIIDLLQEAGIIAYAQEINGTWAIFTANLQDGEPAREMTEALR